MASASPSRRSYGTGSLLVWTDANGACLLVRQVGDGGRQVKRRLGLKRAADIRDGLTRAHAERELRGLMDELAVDPQLEEITLDEAGRRHVERLQLLVRKRSTL